MKRVVILGSVLFLTANVTFADGITVLPDLSKTAIPFADPLAAKQVTYKSEVTKQILIGNMKLRPAADITNSDTEQTSVAKGDDNLQTNPQKEEIIKIENSKLQASQEDIIDKVESSVQKIKSDKKEEAEQNEIETINKEVLPKNTETESSDIVSASVLDEIKPKSGSLDEKSEDADAIELEVGKGKLFVPNTEKKEIPTEKINLPKPEMYNNMPRELRTQDINNEYAVKNSYTKEKLNTFEMKYDVDEAFTSKEFGPYHQYKKEQDSAEIEYKLNPNLSVKNAAPTGIEVNAGSEPLMILRPIKKEEADIESLKKDEQPVTFSAGEPAHNQINAGKRIFRF